MKIFFGAIFATLLAVAVASVEDNQIEQPANGNLINF